MATDGQLRPSDDWQPPDWFGLIRAARWLGVAPWELARQPAGWFDAAAAVMEAEAHAQQARAM